MLTPKPKDVVLLCNPQAGGRWRALADVLDSDEAKSVRRIVTDDIEDVREALTSVGLRARLLCIYGGDGTIYHIVNELLRHQPFSTHKAELPRLALVGGGTMNVTGRACGMTGSPGDNFRAIMRAYLADQLMWREVPTLEIQHSQGGGPGGEQGGAHKNYGFTFGLGPIVRLLAHYESGDKGKLAAVGIGLRAIAATMSPLRTSFDPMLADMVATVTSDSSELPHRHFAAVFANTTGAINRGIEPFVGDRSPGRFHFLAYAISSRELALQVPMLARAHLPLDRGALLKPRNAWRALTGLAARAGTQREIPRELYDRRYVNQPAAHVRILTREQVYTLDGEILPCAPPPAADDPAAAFFDPHTDATLDVRLGPGLQLALRPEIT